MAKNTVIMLKHLTMVSHGSYIDFCELYMQIIKVILHVPKLIFSVTIIK